MFIFALIQQMHPGVNGIRQNPWVQVNNGIVKGGYSLCILIHKRGMTQIAMHNYIHTEIDPRSIPEMPRTAIGRPESLQTEETNGRPGWEADSAPRWHMSTVSEDRELRREPGGHFRLELGTERETH